MNNPSPSITNKDKNSDRAVWLDYQILIHTVELNTLAQAGHWPERQLSLIQNIRRLQRERNRIDENSIYSSAA